jgi:hypothetical protein
MYLAFCVCTPSFAFLIGFAFPRPIPPTAGVRPRRFVATTPRRLEPRSNLLYTARTCYAWQALHTELMSSSRLLSIDHGMCLLGQAYAVLTPVRWSFRWFPPNRLFCRLSVGCPSDSPRSGNTPGRPVRCGR